jgi:hypothetical protein
VKLRVTGTRLLVKPKDIVLIHMVKLNSIETPASAKGIRTTLYKPAEVLQVRGNYSTIRYIVFQAEMEPAPTPPGIHLHQYVVSGF